MSHRLVLKVGKDQLGKDTLVACKHISVRERILRFLLGAKQQLTILVPTSNVRELEIKEVRGNECYA